MKVGGSNVMVRNMMGNKEIKIRGLEAKPAQLSAE